MAKALTSQGTHVKLGIAIAVADTHVFNQRRPGFGIGDIVKQLHIRLKTHPKGQSQNHIDLVAMQSESRLGPHGRRVAELTRAGKLTSVAGGGDTVAALNQAGAAEDFTYISTAGGAFLEWMEGKVLPGVAALDA